MKIKKFFVGIAAALLTAVTLFCGCLNSNTMIFIDVNKNVTDATRITFYGFKYNEPDLIAIENSIHGFMSVHPDINVNYEGIINDNNAADNFYKIFDLRRNSGHLDDVFMLKQDKRMEDMMLKGDLHNLRDVIDLSAYTDLVKSQIVYPDRSIYFVPMALTSYCLYVNYDLLNKHGKSVPTNFEEFSAICDYFVNDLKTTPVICNKTRSMRTIVQAYGTYGLYQLEDSVSVIDGFNLDARPLAENYLKKGLGFAEDMLNRGWIDAAKTKTTAQTNAKSGGDLFEFMKGEQPFMITGSWATNRITDTEAGKNMNYGVHPLPFLSKEQGGSVLLFDIDICTAVNEHSSNLKAAETFISYFTNPESVWEYCNTNNSYSPLANEKRKPDNKTLVPILDYYTNGQSVLGTNYRLYAFNLNNAIDGATAELLEGKGVDSAYAKLLAGLGI